MRVVCVDNRAASESCVGALLAIMDAWKRKSHRQKKRSQWCTRRKCFVLVVAVICACATATWLRRLLPRLQSASFFRLQPTRHSDVITLETPQLPRELTISAETPAATPERTAAPVEAAVPRLDSLNFFRNPVQPQRNTSDPKPTQREKRRCVPAEWPENRVYPTAFIIGHSKTGSTYFYNTLVQHPQMVKATKKEINFFANTDRTYTDSLAPYIEVFPERKEGRNAPRRYGIDASIEYVSRPDARDRLHASFPCAKLIVLMRDPTVRYYSYFQHIKRACVRTPNSHICKRNVTLEEYVTADLERMEAGYAQLSFTPEVQASGVSYFSLARKHIPLSEIKSACALSMGLYYSRLIEWLDVWPRSQIMIINSELLFEAATFHSIMKNVTAFLEISPYNYELLPPRIIVKDASHTAPGDYGAMPEPFQSRVRAFYEPDLKLLEQHFGVRFTGKFME
jgi:hypothetical protein